MATIKVNNINYYYEESGNGMPLLLIAGLNCDVSVWTSVFSKLNQKFRVIMFDNRDVGRTDYLNTDYLLDDMADDTVRLIRKLGYDKIHVLGHSMGGAIAQSIAHRYSDVVDKLIISNSLAHIPTVSQAALEFAGRLKNVTADVGLSAQAIAPWTYSDDYLQFDNNLERLAELMKLYPFPQRPDGYIRQLKALALFDSTAYLHEIKHLTLIIAGAHDLLTPLSQSQIMADHIPNSQLVVLPGAHLPIIEVPQIFVKTVENFLHS